MSCRGQTRSCLMTTTPEADAPITYSAQVEPSLCIWEIPLTHI